MKISVEVKIGIIVTVAIAVTIWGLNFLKGKNILKPVNSFYAFYEDVGGLDKNAKVFMKGFRIGQVEEIYFDANQTDLLTVVFSISKSFHIPYESVAEVFSSDLMGTKAIRIIPAASTRMYEPGDTLPTGFAPGIDKQIQDQIIPLKDKAEIMIMRVDSLLWNLNNVFDKETTASLQQSIQNLERSTGHLNHLMSNIESITSNIEDSNDKITSSISNISSISDSIAASELKSAINKANESLDQIHQLLAKINEGEGNLGLLVNKDSLYYNLESLTAEIDKLAKDLQEHPEKYIQFSVFGGNKKTKK